MRCLKRVAGRDYRAVVAQACHRHATRAASLAVVLYDVTSLHFEGPDVRTSCARAGMSKEHRAGLQVTGDSGDRFFRMTKSDLAAQPVFHRLEDSIQAHLTIVFADLAVSREAQARAGLSISRVLKVLRPLRSATITIGAQQVTAQPRIPAEAQTLLNDLGWTGH
jgi:hypothetical protein